MGERRGVLVGVVGSRLRTGAEKKPSRSRGSGGHRWGRRRVVVAEE